MLLSGFLLFRSVFFMGDKGQNFYFFVAALQTFSIPFAKVCNALLELSLKLWRFLSCEVSL